MVHITDPHIIFETSWTWAFEHHGEYRSSYICPLTYRLGEGYFLLQDIPLTPSQTGQQCFTISANYADRVNGMIALFPLLTEGNHPWPLILLATYILV